GPFRVGAALDRLAAERPAPVVFIALHGPFGEDGTVQALLEAGGLAYTGSGVLGSAIGMDKAVQKRIWRGLGLPVLEWREVRAVPWRTDHDGVLGELEAFASGAGDPRLMIKPARLGSSVGMTLAHDASERGSGLDLAFRYDTMAVVEPYLSGARDLEVAIIGTEPPLGVYGPGEIVAGHEFYDYAAKYTPGLSETSVHAEIPDMLRTTMKKLARDAYRATGTEGFARVDFLVRNDEVYLSEINTIPGFTPISLFPTMPAEAGLDFTAVCRRIIDLALERHATRASSRVSPGDLPR
ncbi:MAG: D-alanine--D-alanine ligase A, partial [Chloroflexota bacterium]